MRRLMTTTFTVLALLAFTAAMASAAEPTGKPLSLFDLYMHSMPVGGVLTIMSFITISLGLTWTFTMRIEDMVPPHIPEELHQIFAEGPTDEAVEQAKSVVAGSPSMLGVILAGVLEKKDFGYQAMVEAAEEIGAAEANKYGSKVSWESLLSSSGTLVGLLGTVTGIIGSFLKMSSTAGGADPNVLAANIGEALVCTAMGISVGVIGLVFYFFLRNRVNQASIDSAVYTREITDYFRPER